MKAVMHIFFSGLICSLLCASAFGQEMVRAPRDIAGIVFEQDGKPLEGAKVCALGTRPMSGGLPCSKSNAEGQFLISVYVPDRYTIAAEHVERGYPGMLLRVPGAYGKPDPIFPTVVIDDVTVADPVKITMGAKAGRLLLTILDADSGQTIDKGLIRLCKAGDREMCYSISTGFRKGHFEVLTPADPFTINFETWYGPVPEYHGGFASGPSGYWVARIAFDKQGLPLEPIQVSLGGRKELTVRLK